MLKQKFQTDPKENAHARTQVQYNRSARHEYSIEETFDAGLSLVGTEVKSIRQGQVALRDAFCRIEKDEVWIYNMHIAPFEQGTVWNVEPTRKRKLLLHRREIEVIRSEMDTKGSALIPLSLYFQHGYAKIEIGLGKGKKLFDKRDDLHKKDIDREMRRELSERHK